MKKGLILMGVGAGLMYLFDPEQGENRRGQLRDMFGGMLPQTKDAIDAKAEAITIKAADLAEKADTLAAEKISSVGPESTGNQDGEGGEGGEDNSDSPEGNPT